MKTLIIGCSWIRAMRLLKKINNFDVQYVSFGGQGLWKISNYLKSHDLTIYDSIVVQLPTPIRNNAVSTSTTGKFNEFLIKIKKLGEQETSNKIMDDYKDKIFEINQLHDRVVFFLYNVGGYPFRHPYDFGVNIDNKMLRFFEDNQLEHLYLSFESKKGYGSIEEDCDDEEFWEYYHENNPANRKSKNFKKYWSLISPRGVISIDPHPNQKANKIALELINNYFIGD